MDKFGGKQKSDSLLDTLFEVFMRYPRGEVSGPLAMQVWNSEKIWDQDIPTFKKSPSKCPYSQTLCFHGNCIYSTSLVLRF